MGQALKNTPIETLKPPKGITLIKVNMETGLPSDKDSPETIMEAFIDSSIPWEKEGREKENPSSGAPVRGRAPVDSPAPSGYYY
jgi:membrane carboxypeptidase/penicillin-binding protein